jgi:hypothetical protein
VAKLCKRLLSVVAESDTEVVHGTFSPTGIERASNIKEETCLTTVVVVRFPPPTTTEPSLLARHCSARNISGFLRKVAPRLWQAKPNGARSGLRQLQRELKTHIKIGSNHRSKCNIRLFTMFLIIQIVSKLVLLTKRSSLSPEDENQGPQKQLRSFEKTCFH